MTWILDAWTAMQELIEIEIHSVFGVVGEGGSESAFEVVEFLLGHDARDGEVDIWLIGFRAKYIFQVRA